MCPEGVPERPVHGRATDLGPCMWTNDCNVQPSSTVAILAQGTNWAVVSAQAFCAPSEACDWAAKCVSQSTAGTENTSTESTRKRVRVTCGGAAWARGSRHTPWCHATTRGATVRCIGREPGILTASVEQLGMRLRAECSRKARLIRRQPIGERNGE